MEKLKKGFGAFLVPLLSILLAFIIGGIIMAALGADPFLKNRRQGIGFAHGEPPFKT